MLFSPSKVIWHQRQMGNKNQVNSIQFKLYCSPNTSLCSFIAESLLDGCHWVKPKGTILFRWQIVSVCFFSIYPVQYHWPPKHESKVPVKNLMCQGAEMCQGNCGLCRSACRFTNDYQPFIICCPHGDSFRYLFKMVYSRLKGPEVAGYENLS